MAKSITLICNCFLLNQSFLYSNLIGSRVSELTSTFSDSFYPLWYWINSLVQHTMLRDCGYITLIFQITFHSWNIVCPVDSMVILSNLLINLHVFLFYSIISMVFVFHILHVWLHYETFRNQGLGLNRCIW